MELMKGSSDPKCKQIYLCSVTDDAAPEADGRPGIRNDGPAKRPAPSIREPRRRNPVITEDRFFYVILLHYQSPTYSRSDNCFK